MAVWDVVFNVLSFLPFLTRVLSLKTLNGFEREWIEIGILNIHFGQFSTSLFSFLVSHFLSTPSLILDGVFWRWCVCCIQIRHGC